MVAVELGARRLVVLPTSHACMQVCELVLDHLGKIRRKIADLKRFKRAMEETAAQCSGERTPDQEEASLFARTAPALARSDMSWSGARASDKFRGSSQR